MILASIRLFAANTSLYIIVDDPVSSANTLNSNLSKILTSSQTWFVSFNPMKTESIIFLRKRKKTDHPPLFFDNTNISQVSTHKHLRDSLTEDAKGASHIIANIDNAWKRIGLLKTLKFVISRSTLENLYFAFIRPLLEYADGV